LKKIRANILVGWGILWHGLKKADLLISWKEDTSLSFTYIASLESHPDYRDAERDIEIWKSLFELKTEEIDSVKLARVFVGKPTYTGELEPVEDVNVRIYVKRLFGLLPVSEEFESTDEEGYFDFEFPLDIPGDETGNLTVVAQVNDHEEFGNLEFQTQVKWGIPVSYDQTVEARELWLSSSNVPNLLVITVSILVLAIITVIIYIISILIQIKRIGME